MANVSTIYTVKAHDLGEAYVKALDAAREGNVSWSYDGADDSTIEISD